VWKTKEVTLSMQGGCCPEGSSVDIGIASIYTEDSRVSELEDLSYAQSLEFLRTTMSVPVQMMQVS
jgi:hypothetical protein